jgi:hypothetical protein
MLNTSGMGGIRLLLCDLADGPVNTHACVCGLQVSDKLAASEEKYDSLLAKCKASGANLTASNTGVLL